MGIEYVLIDSGGVHCPVLSTIGAGGIGAAAKANMMLVEYSLRRACLESNERIDEDSELDMATMVVGLDTKGDLLRFRDQMNNFSSGCKSCPLRSDEKEYVYDGSGLDMLPFPPFGCYGALNYPLTEELEASLVEGLEMLCRQKKETKIGTSLLYTTVPPESNLCL